MSKDFDEQVVDLIKSDYPSATESHIANIKKEIGQLAFSKRYNTYSVSDIYLTNKSRFEYKDNHTGEDSGARTDSDSIGNLTEDEANKLPPDQYARWSDLKAAEQSRYVD